MAGCPGKFFVATSTSAVGQKQTNAGEVGMYAKCQKQTLATQQTESLFDHLVGDGEHPWRHLDAERARRLQVDGEFEFGRLRDRQVGGLGALEDIAGIDADLT